MVRAFSIQETCVFLQVAGGGQGFGIGLSKGKVKSVIFCGLSVQFCSMATECKSLKLCFWGEGR